MQATIHVNFPEQGAYDIMCSMIESGGILYWAEIRNLQRDKDLNITSFEVREESDEEQEETEWVTMDAQKVVEGMIAIAQSDIQNLTLRKEVTRPHVARNRQYRCQRRRQHCAVRTLGRAQVRLT